MRHSEFTALLIKGQIAETVFEQMMRETDRFTVLSFGYEKILPEVARMNRMYEKDETLQTIRRAPDFAVISKRTKKVRLVEVKYRRKYSQSDLYDVAVDINNSWDPSYLFLATQDGFYYGSVQKIVINKGFIPELSERTVSKELQKEYLSLIRHFES